MVVAKQIDKLTVILPKILTNDGTFKSLRGLVKNGMSGRLFKNGMYGRLFIPPPPPARQQFWEKKY